MKKIIPLIIILIFCFVVFNSKKDYYEKSEEFYHNSFTGEIEKIIEGRGTKVYYENESFFYEEDYEGEKLKVGDLIRKNNAEITIMRKNSSGEYIEIGKGKSIEPNKSYFNYFFGS